MKIWNKLNLLVIGLIISILPTFAVSNWAQIDNYTYIDTNSLRKENYSNSNYNNYYSIWSKKLNNGSKPFLDMESFYNSKILFSLEQLYFDCKNKRLALKCYISYDLVGNVVVDNTIMDYNLLFTNIAPETIGEKIYDYVCTGRF